MQNKKTWCIFVLLNNKKISTMNEHFHSRIQDIISIIRKIENYDKKFVHYFYKTGVKKNENIADSFFLEKEDCIYKLKKLIEFLTVQMDHGVIILHFEVTITFTDGNTIETATVNTF